MGIYLNPGNDGFREAVNSEIYVDKTGLIAQTNRYMNLEGYTGEVLLVGISYHKKDKNRSHSCVIEKVKIGL